MNQHLGVYLGRTVFCTPNVPVALYAVDDDTQRLANLLGFYLGTDVLLHAHQFVEPALFHLLRHIVLVVFGRVGSFLLGIGKGTHALKASPLGECYQFLKILIGLAGESYHQRRTDMDAGHFTAQALHQVVGFLLGDMALHAVEHVVADMLQGDVEVLADIFLLPHHPQQVPREMRRIGIVQSYPFHALNVGHLLHKFCNMLLTVDVHAVIGQFLRNDIKLLDTLTDHPTHLIEDLLHGTALVLARNQWYGAVGAMSVAAFRYLYIGIVAGRRQDPLPTSPYRERRRQLGVITPLHTGRGLGVGLQVIQQLPIVELPVPAIDLGNLGLQVCQIALRETAHDVEALNASLGLGLCKLQDRIDALLLCISNESAGIDDHDFPLRVIAIMCTMITVGLHQSHQVLRIHQILRAPK